MALHEVADDALMRAGVRHGRPTRRWRWRRPPTSTPRPARRSACRIATTRSCSITIVPSRAGQLDAARRSPGRRRSSPRWCRARRSRTPAPRPPCPRPRSSDQRAVLRVNAGDRSEQPQQQIDGVDGLVHQRAAAVERRFAAPARAGVVFGRAIPLHPARCQHRRAERCRRRRTLSWHGCPAAVDPESRPRA